MSIRKKTKETLVKDFKEELYNFLDNSIQALDSSTIKLLNWSKSNEEKVFILKSSTNIKKETRKAVKKIEKYILNL